MNSQILSQKQSPNLHFLKLGKNPSVQKFDNIKGQQQNQNNKQISQTPQLHQNKTKNIDDIYTNKQNNTQMKLKLIQNYNQNNHSHLKPQSNNTQNNLNNQYSYNNLSTLSFSPLPSQKMPQQNSSILKKNQGQNENQNNNASHIKKTSKTPQTKISFDKYDGSSLSQRDSLVKQSCGSKINEFNQTQQTLKYQRQLYKSNQTDQNSQQNNQNSTNSNQKNNSNKRNSQNFNSFKTDQESNISQKDNLLNYLSNKNRNSEPSQPNQMSIQQTLRNSNQQSNSKNIYLKKQDFVPQQSQQDKINNINIINNNNNSLENKENINISNNIQFKNNHSSNNQQIPNQSADIQQAKEEKIAKLQQQRVFSSQDNKLNLYNSTPQQGPDPIQRGYNSLNNNNNLGKSNFNDFQQQQINSQKPPVCNNKFNKLIQGSNNFNSGKQSQQHVSSQKQIQTMPNLQNEKHVNPKQTDSIKKKCENCFEKKAKYIVYEQDNKKSCCSKCSIILAQQGVKVYNITESDQIESQNAQNSQNQRVNTTENVKKTPSFQNIDYRDLTPQQQQRKFVLDNFNNDLQQTIENCNLQNKFLNERSDDLQSFYSKQEEKLEIITQKILDKINHEKQMSLQKFQQMKNLTLNMFNKHYENLDNDDQFNEDKQQNSNQHIETEEQSSSYSSQQYDQIQVKQLNLNYELNEEIQSSEEFQKSLQIQMQQQSQQFKKKQNSIIENTNLDKKSEKQQISLNFQKHQQNDSNTQVRKSCSDYFQQYMKDNNNNNNNDNNNTNKQELEDEEVIIETLQDEIDTTQQKNENENENEIFLKQKVQSKDIQKESFLKFQDLEQNSIQNLENNRKLNLNLPLASQKSQSNLQLPKQIDSNRIKVSTDQQINDISNRLSYSKSSQNLNEIKAQQNQKDYLNLNKNQNQDQQNHINNIFTQNQRNSLEIKQKNIIQSQNSKSNLNSNLNSNELKQSEQQQQIKENQNNNKEQLQVKNNNNQKIILGKFSYHNVTDSDFSQILSSNSSQMQFSNPPVYSSQFDDEEEEE
ncbi:hypothetical protein PPERSA_01879 [Pseudocohnilembus persalinus]|uniref:Uncharacterized protein n=1 Tax=Pseudocohnilembus persalinus TaxID=266149 RepID=A0A0V0R267_PSEPJ|nr:hypothetical protein PPERSA_01879 [Pseudocohnilembus persalinus]|eukprot:KRX08626.1 hypothetical protein PPERSA_01879 [Pseudocohnilembus persalinus]